MIILPLSPLHTPLSHLRPAHPFHTCALHTPFTLAPCTPLSHLPLHTPFTLAPCTPLSHLRPAHPFHTCALHTPFTLALGLISRHMTGPTRASEGGIGAAAREVMFATNRTGVPATALTPPACIHEPWKEEAMHGG